MALRLDQKHQLLASQPILDALGRDALHVLAFSARERALAAGDRLFAKGDASDGGYVVASGEIMLDPVSSTLQRRSFGPGALIGEVALITETQRPATATASQATSVLAISRVLMLQVLEAHPESAAKLRAYVAGRLDASRSSARSLVG